MTREITVETDDDFESCDNCIHSDDTTEICKMRGCAHAILDSDIKECYQQKKSEEADVIKTPKRATNGDVTEKIFGKDVYFALIRMMYLPCCKKLKKWWDTPYKKVRQNK